MRFISVRGINLGCNAILGRSEWIPPFDSSVVTSSVQSALVTGGAGSVGTSLVRQLIRLGIRTIILDCDEERLYQLSKLLYGVDCVFILADITDLKQIEMILEAHAPNVVFHLAAKKHVKLTQSGVRTAYNTNVIGTLNLLEAISSMDCTSLLVFASSDKVVAAHNVLGLTKRLAENICSGFAREWSGLARSVRLCNVLGSSNNVLDRYVSEALTGNPLEVFSADLSRFFCSIYEATDLLIEAISHSYKNHILTLDVGAPTTLIEFASRVAGELALLGYPTSYWISERLSPVEARHEALWGSSENVIRPASIPGVAEIEAREISFTRCQKDLRELINRRMSDDDLVRELQSYSRKHLCAS